MPEPITTSQVFQWIMDHIWQIIVCLGLFIQITPIKISPITWLVNWLFKPIRQEMNDMEKRIKDDIGNVKDELTQDINDIKDVNKALMMSTDKGTIGRLRWEIRTFYNTLKNNQKHSKDEYRQILDDNVEYHKLIKKCGLTNGLIDEEIEYITKHYNRYKDGNERYF